MTYRTYTLLFLIMAMSSLTAQDQYSFAGKDIPPGTRHEIKLPVSAGTDTTFIPVTVFRGVKPGPTLGITAGVHGYEYPPIMAAQRITQQLDPTQLSGTLLLVQIANVPSFQGRSPFVNPQDGKNLNRSFPGNPSGTITERIAHQITEQVITQSDYFVDMHGGDAPEDLRPYSAYYRSDTFPEASAAGREMALAMGYDHVVVFDIPNERVKYPSIYCSQEAFQRGIPSVDIECGRLGLAGKEEIEQIENAVFSLLRQLKMLPGAPTQTSGQLIIRKRVSMRSTHTGIFYPLKQGGDYIAKGMKIGYITDYFGNVLEEVFAKSDGIVLYIVGTPPVEEGQTLVSIGIAGEE